MQQLDKESDWRLKVWRRQTCGPRLQSRKMATSISQLRPLFLAVFADPSPIPPPQITRSVFSRSVFSRHPISKSPARADLFVNLARSVSSRKLSVFGWAVRLSGRVAALSLVFAGVVGGAFYFRSSCLENKWAVYSEFVTSMYIVHIWCRRSVVV